MTVLLTPYSILFILVFFYTQTAGAAFTHNSVYHLDRIRQSSTGGYCFYPGTAPPPRQSTCRHLALKALLHVHTLNQQGPGLSIVYYDLQDLTVLGGTNWEGWNATTGRVGLCLSGIIEGIQDAYLTVCRYSEHDDDHDDSSAHIAECVLRRPQKRVVDKCYWPPPSVSQGFQLSDEASSALTILGAITALFGLPGAVWVVIKWVNDRRIRNRRRRRRAARHN
ncbi:hypothetical protein BKA62DRAFT_722423 [Auriculariales sp. MPI-PUGE-AT-0066]|nr:hypothetical protein BKA62DRAFT_722423 [Auriculariales sp. MPI-PUGE-AT-0066]